MIKIYRDDSAQSIFLEDANGAQFPNSLQAVLSHEDSSKVSIVDLARSYEIVSNELFSEFVNENSQQYGVDGSTTVNALNAEFSASGTPSTDLPVITSPTSINAVSGEVINYELTADFGVGYEWNNLPQGLGVVQGNLRKLVGVLTSGTYTPSMSAINYNGSDSETLTINVSNPPFANTKSINFVNNDYLEGNASAANSVLGRVGNGSGSSDAWTISFWFKAGSNSNSEQTIFYFGANSEFSGGLRVLYNGSNKSIELFFGDFFNNLSIKTPANEITTGQWSQFIITYDGGTTGVQSGLINDYYSRFSIYKNGVETSYNNSNTNYGYNSDIKDDEIHVGRYVFGNHMRNNCRVDELAIFDGDQSANVADIYNSGSPFDLSGLTNPPSNWWRMGDGDTYPLLSDSIGTLDFTMVNMTAANIVNDTP